MSMNLLPASVNSLDLSQAPEVSTSLVPLAQRAITTRAGQIGLVPSGDAFAWSSSTRRSAANFIHGTLVEDSQGDEKGDANSDRTGRSVWEYVSAWTWSSSVESTAIADYLSYAASSVSWSGRLIDLYA
jgi:hypothetical protein